MNGGELIEQGYRFGVFRLLPLRRRLLCGDNTVQLSSRAIGILTTLVERHDRIVSKDEILSEVWPGASVEEHNLTVHVSMLRKALGPDVITTIPGRGYKFIAEIEQTEGAIPIPAPGALDIKSAGPKPETNLPERLTVVIGREVELDELETRLSRNRFVTLTGPGGIGKTWLAIELGWRLMRDFPDGVWLIDLAPLTDPAEVTSATASVLGMAPRGTTVEAIATAIDKNRQLLIFDNCEHLIGAAATLIAALLRRVPTLSIMATSQETLRIPGEQVYRLDPLALPPVATDPSPRAAAKGSGGKIASFGAVALFLERAQAADRRFELGDDNEASVVEICRRLDGIPRALEMAAARLSLLGIECLRARLEKRLDMLSSGSRIAERRHRTLRDMVVWSYGLLDAAEQKVFRRLALFAGNFPLDAAIAVVADSDGDHWDVVAALGRLVDKSLVMVEGGEHPHYYLLETLRLYTLELLGESDEFEVVAERHARSLGRLPPYRSVHTPPSPPALAERAIWAAAVAAETPVSGGFGRYEIL